MENIEKGLEEFRQKSKQEFMSRFKLQSPVSPDAQAVLMQLREKTGSIDAGELPTDLDRIDQMKYAYVMAVQYTSGFNVTVTLCEDAPFPGMGYLQIEGMLLKFTDTEYFSRIAAFSDSMEIYPKSDSTIRITFVFRDLTHKNSEGRVD